MMRQKKKILFIINPVSGIGKQKRVENAIKKHLDHSEYDYEIAHTEYAHHATKISAEAQSKGIDIVVAIGGDGSANDVATGIVNTEMIMGVIPVGSGNGLAHFLKIPFSFKKSIRIICRNNVSRIDTATINNNLFISIAGLGFDALVAEEFTKCSRRGFWSYIKTILKEFRIYKPATYKIKFDGKEIERTALMVSFANSDQFGYNAHVAPQASINDGLIDLCIIQPVSFLKAIPMAHKLFHKSLDTSKNVEVYKVREASVETDSPVSCHLDGDPAERLSSAEVKIFPKSLNIIIP
jgi:diacylglycerol kinase (ATP)